MADFFELTSSTTSVNQGTGGTSLNWKRFKHLLITPLDYRITPQMQANLKASLQAKAVDDNPDERIYIIKNIFEAEPANTNDINLEFGYGHSELVYNGQKGTTLGFSSSNLVEQVLRQRFNGREGDFLVIPVDEAFNFICTQDNDSTVGASAMGFTMFQFRANDLEPDYGSGSKQTVSLKFADWAGEANNGNLLVLKTNVNMNAIKQVADVNIVQMSSLATRVVSLAFPIANDYEGANLAEKYAAIMAANPALLIGTNHATGAALTVSSAVAGTINGRSVITYTFASTNYPTVGGFIDLRLDDVSALSAVLIKYFETPEILSIEVI